VRRPSSNQQKLTGRWSRAREAKSEADVRPRALSAFALIGLHGANEGGFFPVRCGRTDDAGPDVRQCMAVNAIAAVPHLALQIRNHGLTDCRLVWLNTWEGRHRATLRAPLTAEGAPTQSQGAV
jgi:hypothetical protein